VVNVVQERTDNNMIRYMVRDNGPGIPPDKQNEVFNVNVRFDPTAAEGHGLGLSIVRRIVDRLGGEVGVNLLPSGGCEFWFSLPEYSPPKPDLSHPQ
jgi:signal transduction histidine kinase